MDQQLEQALAFANFQSALGQQRRLLKEKFEIDTLFAHSGGLFKLTQTWVATFDPTVNWHLDQQGNPVYITDPAAFIAEARTVYQTALQAYGEAYQALRRHRSVDSLTAL
jgi:hypothetical protein